jgi:hypothetical protein
MSFATIPANPGREPPVLLPNVGPEHDARTGPNP